MKPLKTKGKNPEAKIQDSIIKKLRYLGWFVKVVHGNAYQSGFPDLYITHSKYGARWVEVKRPNMKGSKFTGAQLEEFPKFCANGAGVWILTSDSDEEINKLFKACNWWQYLKLWRC